LLGESHFIPLLVDQWREGGPWFKFKQHRPDVVISHTMRDEWGIPAHRQFIQVDSEWVEGSTLPWRTSSPQPLPESFDRAWI